MEVLGYLTYALHFAPCSLGKFIICKPIAIYTCCNLDIANQEQLLSIYLVDTRSRRLPRISPPPIWVRHSLIVDIVPILSIAAFVECFCHCNLAYNLAKKTLDPRLPSATEATITTHRLRHLFTFFFAAPPRLSSKPFQRAAVEDIPSPKSVALLGGPAMLSPRPLWGAI